MNEVTKALRPDLFYGKIIADRMEQRRAAQVVLKPMFSFGCITADIADDGRIAVTFDNPVIVRGLTGRAESVMFARWILEVCGDSNGAE